MEIVIIEFPNVKDAICHISEPVRSTTLHLIILKEAIVDVRCFEHGRAPTGSFALRKLANVLNPELLALRYPAFALRLRFLHSQSDRFEDIFKVCLLR